MCKPPSVAYLYFKSVMIVKAFCNNPSLSLSHRINGHRRDRENGAGPEEARPTP